MLHTFFGTLLLTSIQLYFATGASFVPSLFVGYPNPAVAGTVDTAKNTATNIAAGRRARKTAGFILCLPTVT